MTMVDIGKVEKLVCVKTAAEEGTSVLEAQGTKGAVRFVLFSQAYSRHRFVLHGFGHSSRVEVFDVRLLAFLNSLYCIDQDNLKLSFERLNRGDEIKLPHYDKAWEFPGDRPHADY